MDFVFLPLGSRQCLRLAYEVITQREIDSKVFFFNVLVVCSLYRLRPEDVGYDTASRANSAADDIDSQDRDPLVINNSYEI